MSNCHGIFTQYCLPFHHLTFLCAIVSVFGLWESSLKIRCFRPKFCSAMRPISGYGYASKRNSRIWADESPEEVQELPLYPLITTILCRGNRRAIFLQKWSWPADGRYRAMITDCLLPEIEDLDLDDIWFQQDGAECHTACETMAVLRERFGEQLISCFGPVNWPPTLCDITSLDFFFGGYVK